MDLYNNFNIDERAFQELKNWVTSLRKPTVGDPTYEVGGRLCYRFFPTNVGTEITVVDTITGESLDLSHSEYW